VRGIGYCIDSLLGMLCRGRAVRSIVDALKSVRLERTSLDMCRASTEDCHARYVSAS